MLVAPSLLGHPTHLTLAVAQELAYMLSPGWPDLKDYEAMKAFAWC